MTIALELTSPTPTITCKPALAHRCRYLSPAMRSSLFRAITLPFIQPVTHIHHRKLSVQTQFEIKHGSQTENIKIPHVQPSTRQRPDPYALVAPEINHIRKCLLSLIGTAHPGLADVAEYCFLQPSKLVRSILVLLFARATNGCESNCDQKDWEAICEMRTGRSEELDRPLSQSDVLNEWNPSMLDHTASFESVFMLQKCVQFPPYPPPRPFSTLSQERSQRVPCPPSILPTQIRLAQIIEMIHIASLLHDGITTRSEQGASQIHGFGNKIAILGGDFLLGRASWALSRLGEREVVELVASVISNQVEGEFLGMEAFITPQLKSPPGPASLQDAWNMYIKKTYLKTASLLAKGARSAVILGGCRQGNVLRDVAYLYGRNLGMALQVSESNVTIG